ncbi:MAG: hypothetical protein UU54_C0008G0010 [Candidatus Yanofskybacteria bacterium GW2011_GWA2_41_22]|uniref:Uncharacterized protein n=1 Tax=Candidatus Yanofskybacteria bacterium GW2011_GWA2_41_22 TaxID=1619023 RepID=A0A0G0YLQ7_9BACT|nr:MAG: hypothetical protein UU54_C0008G0010 [Candidatus Yanofskybacteria bacterium GW2011_GWA2_41_22]
MTDILAYKLQSVSFKSKKYSAGRAFFLNQQTEEKRPDGALVKLYGDSEFRK